ncbi:RAB GDP-dissociation inhibitor family member protein [Theileria equi strain WA]|uniref:RAB GDP-dissociation inhibitor family member protein n=1 Tax=Theileria equi strain WA TaxID=1537102 RepID=L0B175_THEEQ|nr:RAB GDP-dissociation inhibitor family member protein [Theileria equi strain WA]AFZ80874.1 RAB GDP-dissociation inhibitor family member protein [Theileria equi strain WA]|eukprot:XP_004830540.1 RAB GDP-dissociation inhibitor family member protein [Theileria equi strain WA]
MKELEFDTVVYGTGITASLIAASLTRNGFRVLQVDFHSSYGGDYRTFTFKQIISEQDVVKLPEDSQGISEEGEQSPASQQLVDQLGKNNPLYEHKVFYQVSPFSDNVDSTHESLLRESSRYAIDLWPKFIYSKSAAVELFLRSSSDTYLRFCSNSGPILIGREGEPELNEVCNSKGSIFRSKYLEPMEKRILMKFINELSDLVNTKVFSSDSLKRVDFEVDSQGSRFQGLEEDGTELWVDFLRRKNFTEKMIELTSHGICLGGNEYKEWTKTDGLKRLLKYVESIGVFGDLGGCLLYTLYGTSDIVHALCRLSAVHGCTFMLNTFVESVHTNEGKVSGITLSNSIFVKTKMLISEYLIPGHFVEHAQVLEHLHVISFVTKTPLFEGPNIAVLVPRSENDEPIHVIQTDLDSGTAPKGAYVLHLMTVDKAPPSHLTSFNDTTGVAARLIDAYKSLPVEIESTALALYTTHKLGDARDKIAQIDAHQGFLGEKDKETNDTDKVGFIQIPPPKGRPAVLLLEEVSLAHYICARLLGKEVNNLDLYDRIDLDKFLDFEKAEEEVESSPFDKLDEIIEKFSS